MHAAFAARRACLIRAITACDFGRRARLAAALRGSWVAADARPRTPLTAERRAEITPVLPPHLAAAPPPPDHFKKRTVALLVCYDGGPFRGNTANPALPRGSTVDDVLEDALLSAGLILPTNYGSAGLGRLGWSRSSRTDKGVSSLATWVTCRLEVDEDWWDAHGAGGEGLVRRLEPHLPPAVRVFQASIVPRRFQARENCCTRSYHYYLPLRVLTAPAAADGGLLTERLAALSAALRLFEGTHPFHNFTKRALYRPPTRRGGGAGEDEEEAEEEEAAAGRERAPPEAAEAAEATERVAGSIARGCYWYTQPPGRGDPDVVGNQQVLFADCGLLTELVGGEPCVRLTLVGESFLLHQIRKMVATALAVARGHLPPAFIPAALCRPARTRVPMVGAATLLLADASFRPFRPDTSTGAPDPAHSARQLDASEAVRARVDGWAAASLLPPLGAALADAAWDEFVEKNLVDMCAEPEDVALLMEQAEAYKASRQEREGTPW